MTEQNPDMDFAAPALSEIEVGAIWSLQGNRGHRLPELVRGLFGDFARMNEMLVREPLRLLQLSPHEALLLTGAADLPANIENFTVDLAHGYRAFRLDGGLALHFADDYTSADLAPLRERPGCLRCLLGRFPVILWREDSACLNLLVEYSYAQSFADHVGNLMTRWRPRADAKLASPTGEGLPQ